MIEAAFGSRGGSARARLVHVISKSSEEPPRAQQVPLQLTKSQHTCDGGGGGGALGGPTEEPQGSEADLLDGRGKAEESEEKRKQEQPQGERTEEGEQEQAQAKVKSEARSNGDISQ